MSGRARAFAAACQACGAVAVVIGLFAALSWPLALVICGTLAVAAGTVLEVGARPRAVPAPPSAAQRRAASLADLAAHTSGR